MNNYIDKSIFIEETEANKTLYMQDGFISTINFFNDIINISDILK